MFLNFPIFFEPRLIISPSKWHFLTKVIFSTDPVSDWLENTNNKNLGEIRCCTDFFIRTNFLYFHTFFKVRLIISPPKLHFLTKIIFSHWPSIRLIGKYQQNNSCGNWVLYTFFIRNNFQYFCTFFQTKAYNKPFEITFSHPIYFFTLTQHQVDWKIPTKKFLRK